MQSFEIETQDSLDPFADKADGLQSAIESELIVKSREAGEIAAQRTVDAYWVNYERSLVPL